MTDTDEEMNRLYDWRKYATPADEIPPGFVELGLVGGGFLQVHVDAIASYGPMHFVRQVGPNSCTFATEPKPRDASGFAIDFHGTSLRLRGDTKSEQTMVSHSIREIARLCTAAHWKLQQAKCER